MKARSSVKRGEVALRVHKHDVTFRSWWRYGNAVFPGRPAAKAKRDVRVRLLRRAESRHGQTRPPPRYLRTRCLGCSPPRRWLRRLSAQLRQCCTSRRCRRGAVSWRGGPQGQPNFQGCPFLTWPLLVSHGRARTLRNPV